MKLFGLSFSLGYYPSIQQRTGKGFIYFITLRIISQSERTMIVPEHFVDLFVFLPAELSTSISFLCHKFLQKVFFCFAWPIKSLAWTLARARFLAFFPLKQNQTTYIKLDGGYLFFSDFEPRGQLYSMRVQRNSSVGYRDWYPEQDIIANQSWFTSVAQSIKVYMITLLLRISYE